MSDVKCFGCGVRLNVGAHTFKLDDNEWHCACLLRYQNGAVEAVHALYDKQRKESAELRAALAEALDQWDGWIEQEYTGTKWYEPEKTRIVELRAKFLGDGK